MSRLRLQSFSTHLAAALVRLGACALAVAAFALPSRAAPLTLDDAIRLTLANNQNIKVSAFNPQIARAQVLSAYGQFDPVFSFTRTYREDEAAGSIGPLLRRPLSQSDDATFALSGLTPWGLSYSLEASARNPRNSTGGFADNYSTFGGISITQPLLRGFGFGSTLAGLRVAKASRGISDWQHRQRVIDTVTEVINAYNNLQQARDSLRVAELSRNLAAQTVVDNEKRLAAGFISDADVTQARAQSARGEEGILRAQRNLRDFENRLRLLLGEKTFPINGPALEIVELAPAADLAVDPAADTGRAYELRPDYQAARLGITIDRANLAAAQNALLPTLNFVGSYGYSGADSDFSSARAQVRDRDARSYSAGLVVRIPLTFAEGRGRARAARLNVRKAEAALVNLEQNIALDIAEAAGQIETTQMRVRVARNALDLAQLALDNEQKRLTAGTGTTFLVLRQQEQLSGAQNSYFNALADQRRAIALYERELGTTLQRHGITVE